MRFLFRYLDSAKFAVRDNYCSKSYLIDCGVNESDIELLPDDLLFINKRLTNDSELIEKNYIAIIVHNSMEYIKENEGLFIQFANSIKTKYGLDIVFVPFDLVWYGYDQSEYLNSKIPSSSIVEYEKFLPIEKAYNIIKNAKMVITGRYHASILAQQTSTPFIVVLGSSRWGKTYSYNKVYGSLQRLFVNTPFHENLFMAVDWEEALRLVDNSFSRIANEQKQLFDNNNTKNNLTAMYTDRIKYIHNYLRGD